MTERRNIGEIYWYLSFDVPKRGTSPRWKAFSARERGDSFDHANWDNGNYYLDPEKAQAEMKRLNAELDEEERMAKLKRVKCAAVVESEKDVERYLVNKAMGQGWLPLKYSSGFTTGYPDRCILLPGGVTVWVEVKTTGQKPTKLQQIRIRRLQELGFLTAVIDSRRGVDKFIESIKSETGTYAVQPS